MGKYIVEEYGKIRFYRSEDERPVPGNFARHCHNNYEIIYVVSGTGKYVVEGECYELRPDTLMLFRPGEFHYVDVQESCRYERCVFHFKAGALHGAKEAIEKLSRVPPGEGNFFEARDFSISVAPIFERFSRLSTLPKKDAERLAPLMLTELVLLLAAADPVAREKKKDEPIGARVIRYLNAHLSEPLSLDILCNNFYVSKYYLCRAFKEHNGISILGYLNSKRVMLAKQMIESGETAVAAAEKVGFSDYSTFYRAYRKSFGRAPTSDKNTRKKGSSYERNQ